MLASDRVHRLIDAALLLVCGGLVAHALWASRAWRVARDAPIMLYQGFLMGELGWLPYRDFFDMNLPGTYLAYTGIGAVFGFEDGALLLADRLILAVVSLLTAGVVARVSRVAGALAGLLFALQYVGFGPLQLLQRELLLLVPLAAGVLAATEPRLPDGWRAGLAGLGVGLACTVKPHVAVVLLPLAIYLRAPRSLVALVVGWGLPLAACGVGLVALGLLPDFAASLGYLPLYGALNGDFRALAGAERWLYISAGVLRAGGHWPLILAATGGVVVGSRLGGPAARVAWLIGGLVVACWVYPAGSGQFWQYHWMPLTWAACAAAGLWLAHPTAWVPRIVVALLIAFLALGATSGPVERRYDRPDLVGAWLSEHLRPGDRVQPLDWACCVQHGMLQARAEPATRFLYTFHLYHHVSTPYVQDLRQRFFTELDAADPAFVVEAVVRPKLWVKGPDTVRELPELTQRLHDRYGLVQLRGDLRVWVRNDVAQERGIAVTSP